MMMMMMIKLIVVEKKTGVNQTSRITSVAYMAEVRVLARDGCLGEDSARLNDVLQQVLAHPETAVGPCRISLRVEDYDTRDGESIGTMQLMRGTPSNGQFVKRCRWKMSASGRNWEATLLKDLDPDVAAFPYQTLNSGQWEPPLPEDVALVASLAPYEYSATAVIALCFEEADGTIREFVHTPDPIHQWTTQQRVTLTPVTYPVLTI